MIKPGFLFDCQQLLTLRAPVEWSQRFQHAAVMLSTPARARASRTRTTVALKGAERARTLIDMRIRGMSFEAIGNALRITRARAQQIYQGYLQKLPSGAIEKHRAIERERIADLRTGLWAEMKLPYPKNWRRADRN
jgi:hypothetical protein